LSSTTLAVVAIVAVAALALLLRRGSGSDAASTPRPDPGAPVEPDSDEVDADDSDSGDAPEDDGPPKPDAEHPVPVTLGGVAIVPFGRGVKLVTLGSPDDDSGWLATGIAAGSVSSYRVDEQIALTRRQGPADDPLRPGDFTAARVRRDEEGVWNLETLGREGDFGYTSFAVESAARTALEMFERAGVVQRPVDENGNPIPPGAEDFAEARRRFEETERELAISGDEDEPTPPNDWSSRR